MPQQNVEVLRTVYASVTARGVEGLLAFATEDVVWISDPRFPGGGTHTGEENVRQWLDRLWIYEEISLDVEEIIDLDDRALGSSTAAPFPRVHPKWTGCGSTWSRSGTG